MQPGSPGPGQDPYGHGRPGQDPFGQPRPDQYSYPDPYGPPPADPYSQRAADPYSQRPADPYGEPQYGQPQYGQPQYGQPDYEQQYGSPGYGQQYEQQYGYEQRTPYDSPGYGDAPARSNTPGLLAMMFGILSIPLLCCYDAGVLFAIPAVVLGALGMNRARQGLAGNHGQALAGLICGVITLVLALLFLMKGWPANAFN